MQNGTGNNHIDDFNFWECFNFGGRCTQFQDKTEQQMLPLVCGASSIWTSTPVLEYGASLKGTKKCNEDRFVIHRAENNLFCFPRAVNTTNKSSVVERLKCFAVIDGHGGACCANYVKQTLFARILENWPAQLAAHKIPETLGTVLGKSLKSLEEDYAQVSKRTEDISGACVVVAMYLDGWLCVSNVGDAGAMLLYPNGHAIPMSIFHTNRNEAEHERIMKAGGQVKRGYIEGKIIPSRTIGDFKIKAQHPGVIIADPETRVVKIEKEKGDFMPTLVLASDGFWDIGWEKAASEIKSQSIRPSAHFHSNYSIFGSKQLNSQDPAIALVEYARANGSNDDITVVLARLG